MKKTKKKRDTHRRESAPAVPRLLWDIIETAASMGVRPVTVRAYIDAGHLQPVRLPSTARRRPGDLRLRKLLFRPEDVAAFIERQRAENAR